LTFEEKIKEIFETLDKASFEVYCEDLSIGTHTPQEALIKAQDDVLALLEDYIIIRKHGDLHSEKAVEEVVEWMHGKTVVDKQKLHEFAELLKNRSINYMHHSEIDAFFELLEKKFRELKEK